MKKEMTFEAAGTELDAILAELSDSETTRRMLAQTVAQPLCQLADELGGAEADTANLAEIGVELRS